MNKKTLLIILIIVIGSTFGWALFHSSDEADNEQELSQIPQDVTEKVANKKEEVLSQVIRPENQKSKAFKNFKALDFNADFYLQDPEVTAAQGRKFLEETYQDLKKCYRQGCGQEPDGDGFYDPALTVAMTSMKRILEVALLEPEKLEASEWLTTDELKEMLDVENEDIRKLALKNLLTLHKNDPQVFNEILRETDGLEGEKAADLMEELMKHVDDSNKAAFLQSLEMIAKEKDAYTANQVLQKTEGLKVSKEQIKALGQELCRFKNDTFNFNGLDYSLKNMAANSGHQFTLKSYCR